MNGTNIETGMGNNTVVNGTLSDSNTTVISSINNEDADDMDDEDGEDDDNNEDEDDITGGNGQNQVNEVEESAGVSGAGSTPGSAVQLAAEPASPLRCGRRKTRSVARRRALGHT